MVYANLMKQRCSIQVEDYRVVATNYDSIGTEAYAFQYTTQVSNLKLVHTSFCTLKLVLMVTSVCGENRTYSLEGGKIPNKESTYPYRSHVVSGSAPET